MAKQIKKGQGEYIKCPRCKKRFRRKKSIWNVFRDNTMYSFCQKCEKSFNKWWDEISPFISNEKLIKRRKE